VGGVGGIGTSDIVAVTTIRGEGSRAACEKARVAGWVEYAIEIAATP